MGVKLKIETVPKLLKLVHMLFYSAFNVPGG